MFAGGAMVGGGITIAGSKDVVGRSVIAPVLTGSAAGMLGSDPSCGGASSDRVGLLGGGELSGTSAGGRGGLFG